MKKNIDNKINNKKYLEIPKNSPYISLTAAADYLCVKRENFIKHIRSDCNISLIENLPSQKPNSSFITIDTLKELEKLKMNFHSEHTELNFVIEQYNLGIVEGLARVEIPYYAKQTNCIKAIKNSDLHNVIKSNEHLINETKKLFNSKKYMSLKQAAKILGIENNRFVAGVRNDNSVSLLLGLKGVKGMQYGYSYISEDDLNILLSAKKTFWQNHIEYKMALNEFTPAQLVNITKVKVPYYAGKNGVKTALLASEYYEFEKLIKEIHQPNIVFDSNNFISLSKASKLIGISKSLFIKGIREDSKIRIYDNKDFISFSSHNTYQYIHRDTLSHLQKLKNEFWLNHCDYTTVVKKYGNNFAKNLFSISVPYYAVANGETRAFEYSVINSYEYLLCNNITQNPLADYDQRTNDKVTSQYVDSSSDTKSSQPKNVKLLKNHFGENHCKQEVAIEIYEKGFSKNITEVKVPHSAKRNETDIDFSSSDLINFEQKSLSTTVDGNTSISDNFISLTAAASELGVKLKYFLQGIRKDKSVHIINGIEFKCKSIDSSNSLISINTLEILKTQKEYFWQTHCEYNTTLNKYGKTFLQNITKIQVPYYAKKNRTLTAFITSEIVELEKSNACLLNNSKSLEELMQLLDLTKVTLRNALDEFNLQPLKQFYPKSFYPLETVEFLMFQQREIGSRFISSATALKQYDKKIVTKCQGYPLPSIARRIDTFGSGVQLFYDKFDLDKVSEAFKKQEQVCISELLPDTTPPFEVFTAKIVSNQHYNNLNSVPYTKTKWEEQVNNRMLQLTGSKKTVNTTINRFINATVDLDNFLRSNNYREIYTFTSSELNMFINGLPQRKAHELYLFFGAVEIDIRLKLKNIKSIKKGFSLAKINNPLLKPKKNNGKPFNDNIYTLKQYKLFFNFLININHHKSVFFENSLNLESKSKYLSIWLYLILHLNNAWRHGDITRFPRIYFNDILFNNNILNLDWFKDNNISLVLSRQVISRIIKYEFGVSKTKVEGHFFCSDELATTLATTLLMLELCHKELNLNTYTNYDEPTMMFFNKYNEPGVAIERFLSHANISNFNFQSMKMNKTIMTFIYSLSDETEALLLPKYMRSHLDKNSTLNYLKFNKDDIEFLTEQLFMRGEFGYIYDSLLEIITGNYESISSKTYDIMSIKDFFGEELKIEATVGLLNSFDNERKEITDMLIEFGYDKCLENLEKIYMNKLPSQEENIQCIFSEQGCKMNITYKEDIEFKSEKQCFKCKYSIPSIYVLNTICEDFKSNLALYFSTTSIPNKIKLSKEIHISYDLLKSAIVRYGKDYIYHVLDITPEEFKERFSNILTVDELKSLL